MAKYNDLDMKRWKEYQNIFTDSLWMINRRDKSGMHNTKYHGNFVPQIPHQLLSRYTKKGDWVLDAFMGSGTTLVEAQRMERNSIGIELQKNIAEESALRIKQESKDGIEAIVINANSMDVELKQVLNEKGIDKVQFVIFHPPYWDIIKFSEESNDLSNSKTIEDFEKDFGKVIDNTTQHLEDNRYCGLVIGDKYANSQIVPLGFICMNLFLKRGFILKAIIVKNYGDTEGKSNQQAIWRYRAMSADYYVFKHEYIMVFKKIKNIGGNSDVRKD
jgi:16S rRNA G966 N2-methylase RsmD